MDALETLARLSVAVPNAVRVDVPAAVAFLAAAVRSSEVPVPTALAQVPGMPLGAVRAHHATNIDAARAEFARTRFAVVRGPLGRVAIVAVDAAVAVGSRRVVDAVADARLRVARVRVAVTLTWNAPAKRNRERTLTGSHCFGIAINAHKLACLTRSHGRQKKLFSVPCCSLRQYIIPR